MSDPADKKRAIQDVLTHLKQASDAIEEVDDWSDSRYLFTVHSILAVVGSVIECHDLAKMIRFANLIGHFDNQGSAQIN